MKDVRIEIIAIGQDNIYSVSTIEISPDGDVYLILRQKDADFHTSRHASGILHWKSEKRRIYTRIRKGTPIKDFKGFEFLQTYGFCLESLPRLYDEYKMQKCDGVFAIDMRAYSGRFFNMATSILTQDGLPLLLLSSQLLEDRQIYLFPDCHPMIAIAVGATKGARRE